MEGPSKAEWILGTLLTDSQKLFVLWVVKERLCLTLDDFRTHYGPDFPAATLVGELMQEGFLRQNAGKFELTETSEQVVAHIRGRNQPILLVENDEDFRESVQEYLEMQGYYVLPASDPKTAKEIIGKESNLFLITDIRLLDDNDEMDTSGLILAKQLDPAIPKIIFSSHLTVQLVREILRPTNYPIQSNANTIAKGEGLSKLLVTIQQMMMQSYLQPVTT